MDEAGGSMMMRLRSPTDLDWRLSQRTCSRARHRRPGRGWTLFLERPSETQHSSRTPRDRASSEHNVSNRRPTAAQVAKAHLSEGARRHRRPCVTRAQDTDTVEEAIETLRDNHLGSVPVRDASGKWLGYVGALDLLAGLVRSVKDSNPKLPPAVRRVCVEGASLIA